MTLNQNAEALYIEIDSERTSRDAYNEFERDVMSSFDGDVQPGHARTRHLSECDPSLVAQAWEHAILIARDVGVGVLTAYIYDKATKEDNERRKTEVFIQTKEGPVYISNMERTAVEDAKQRGKDE